MTIPEAKRITRMNEWSQMIHERQQSSQSVRAWCLQNGIRESSYYYWLRIIWEEALRETKNRSGTRVRVEPEKRKRQIFHRLAPILKPCENTPKIQSTWLESNRVG